MKRIGLLLDVGYSAGGTFQYNQQILEALLSFASSEYALEVYYSDDVWAPLIQEKASKIKVNYTPFQRRVIKMLFGIGVADRFISYLFSLTSLRKIMKANLDLVFYPSQDLAGLYLTGNSVNVVHDLMHRFEGRFREVTGNGRRRFRDRLFASMCRSSKAILVDSFFGKKQLMESYPCKAEMIEVLPYIAPSHIVGYQDELNTEYFERLKLPSKFFFYPAQFWPHKNHLVLLQACLLLKPKIKNLHFVFTGPKRFDFERLDKYCTENDLAENVTFLDYVPSDLLGGFYRRARALVMPTFFGPTNIPPLEAIALGCPVAISGIYGMPEQLGEAAIYFNNQSVDDVALTLEKVWLDDGLCSRLVSNGREHFRRWNHVKFNERLLEIVEKVLKS